MQKPRFYGGARTYLISIGLFCGLAFLTLSFAKGYQVNLQTGEVNKHGVVVLNSQPHGASITIDGNRRRQRTNARINLAAGTYQIEVERPGSYTWQQRVVLDPGDAILYEHIMLFAKQPESKVLLPQPVTALAISPNRAHVATLTQETAGGAGVWLGNADNLNRLTLLPNTDPATATLSIAADGNHLAVATGSQILLYGANGGNTSVLTGTGLIGFMPGTNDTVLLNAGGAISSLKGDKNTVLEAATTSVAITPQAWFAALPDGSLIRYDDRGKRSTVLPAGESVITKLMPVGDGDGLLALTTNGTLLNINGSDVVTIAGDVTAAAANPSGGAILYVSNRELHLWRRSNTRDQLITRFGQVIPYVALSDDGHTAYYLQGEELHTIAEDGSNDINLQRLAGPPAWLNSSELLTTSTGGVLRRISLEAK